MLPVRQTLTHWIAKPRQSPVFFSNSIFTRLHVNKCSATNCMSSARLSSASPRSLKRRRLDSPPAAGRPFSTMGPMLVQEIEDKPPSSHMLELTPVEETLTRLLLDVAKYVDETPHTAGHESQIALPQELAGEKVTLRYTGGWVRDKLLGVPSHDIDVAINKLTGYQFGLRMKEYLELPGNLEKYGLESIAANDKQNAKAGTNDKSKTVGGLHKIEANPEKSKHLETTTMRILGLDIDLVNLRKETYSDDSRNPHVEFGTPEEDALRRDATVNAMFYNINTKEIEDFTGRGHEDMAAKIIRTPLEPYQTFKDDPLRVLRLIRFASRLGYTIEPQVLQAMRDGDIKDALRRKISRERVGIELEKSLQGPDPHEALRLIFDLDLYETIFSDPSLGTADQYTPDTEGWKVIIDAVSEIITSEGVLAENLTRDAEERYIAWQLAAMVPYRDAPQPQSAPGKKALPAVAVTVAKEGFKATNKISDVIGASVRNQPEISDIVDKLYERKRRPDKQFEGAEDVTARDFLGMAIRRWGSSWRSQMLYSLLVEISDNLTEVDSIERKYIHFITHLTNLSLLEVHTLKPLLDGKSLAKAIGTAPGPWMKDALDVVMAWQLRNPAATNPEDAIEEVKNHRAANGELTFDLIRHFLKLTIRPLFLKPANNNPSGVTPQGRKLANAPLPRKLGMQAMETPAWKNAKEAHALDILQWVVKSLGPKSVVEVWPMLIPPVLTLVDDWETRYKATGAELLGELLKVVEPELLERTGLGEVFEDALMPCLAYLPPSTPEEEAVRLLGAVYPALIALTRVRYPVGSSSGKVEPKDMASQRAKFLDKVLRDGIIYGISNCHNHPNTLIITCEHLAIFLDEMGIEAVKHIKYVLPFLTGVLSHPLGKASLPMLHQATVALQALIRNCWPRMVEYRGEVLKGITLCWLGVEGEPAAESLRTSLKGTAALLREAIKEEYDLRQDYDMLIQADARLGGLLL